MSLYVKRPEHTGSATVTGVLQASLGLDKLTHFGAHISDGVVWSDDIVIEGDKWGIHKTW